MDAALNNRLTEKSCLFLLLFILAYGFAKTAPGFTGSGNSTNTEIRSGALSQTAGTQKRIVDGVWSCNVDAILAGTCEPQKDN